MTIVRVGPRVKNPTHDLGIQCDEDGTIWGLKLDGGVRAMQEISQTPSTLVIGGGGKKWGTGDPTFTEIEQSTWHGGRGSEFFHDDETRYLDSWQAMTRIPGRLLPQLRWDFATGYRAIDTIAFASHSWKQLLGTSRYIDVSFAASTVNLAADKCYIWLRRRGNPGSLTLELCTDGGDGHPVVTASATKSITVTTSTITDTLSRFYGFDWDTTATLTSGTTYHIKVFGASTDNAVNHWEVGVNEDGTASHTAQIDGTWTAASYSMYFRVVGADAAMKWHWFTISGTFHAISQKDSGDSTLFEWNETTDNWDAVTLDAGDALSGTVKSVAVSKNIAHCARGTGGSDETIWTLTNVSGTATGQDDATAGNKADVLVAYNDAVDGPQIARFENDNWYWSRSDVKARDTDLIFGTDVEFPQGFNGLNMATYNNQVWVRTTDGLWSISNDRPAKLDVGLDAVLEPSTSAGAMLAKDLFLYLAWSYSVERLYGGTLDDVGPWKGAGLPDTRQGVISCMCAGIGGVYMGIDGGTGNTSSVVFFDGTGYEEVFRAWEAGQRVRNVAYQPQNGTTSPARLWISVGGDMVYIPLPDQSMNPLHDSDSRFVHEYSITSPIHDFGVTHFPKFFKGIEISADNLGSVCNIGVDYQMDADVGTSTWTELTNLYQSPWDAAYLNLGNRKKMAYRLRCNTSTAATALAINAIVVTGFARTKLKRQFNLRVKASDLQRTRTGAKDHTWASFYEWIIWAGQQAAALRLLSNEPALDQMFVVIEPPGIFRKFQNFIQSWVGGTMALTLREA